MENDKNYKIRTLELLKKTMLDNDFSYDIYFRVAVIYEYISGNENIWELYNKMQLTRANQISVIPREMIQHKNSFIDLINSFKNCGFDPSHPILTNDKLMVIDGAHRLACSLYFKLNYVIIQTNQKFKNYIPNEYTKEWFEKNNLKECIPYAETIKRKIRMYKNVQK